MPCTSFVALHQYTQTAGKSTRGQAVDSIVDCTTASQQTI